VKCFFEHKLRWPDPKQDAGFWTLWFYAIIMVFLVFSFMPLSWSEAADNNQPVYDGITTEGSEDYFAFLIFNNAYSKDLAQVAQFDENKSGMHKLLSGLAIPDENIIILDNPSKSDFEDAVYEFSKKLNIKSNLIVYYNGLSVNFVDVPQNEILLTSFALPRSNDLFLLERRVSRNSVTLETLISDFIPKRVGQITVLYDACSAQFVSREDDPEHWKVFNRSICVPSKVSGANVIYAGTQTEPTSMVSSLNAILSEKPSLDLQAISSALAKTVADDTTPRDEYFQKHTLVAEKDTIDLTAVCLRKAMQNGILVCNAASEQAETPTPEVAVKTPAPEPAVKVAKTPTAPLKKGSDMRADWAAAKRAGRCKPYQEFAVNYPDAVFKIKAERAIEILCGKAPAKEPAPAETVVATAKLAPEKQEPVQAETPTPEVAVETPAPEPAVKVAIEEPLPNPSEPELVEEPIQVAVKKETVQPPSPKNAFKDWMSARKENSCESFQNFKSDYPKSVFTVKAQQAIDKLCVEDEPKAVIASKPELAPAIEPVEVEEPVEIETEPTVAVSTPKMTVAQNWLAARAANTCEGFLRFLENNPKSLFASKAEQIANRKCTSDDRQAFLQNPEGTDNKTKKATLESPTPADIVSPTPAKAVLEEEPKPQAEAKVDDAAPSIVTPLNNKPSELLADNETEAAKNSFAFVVINQDYTGGLEGSASAKGDKAAILSVLSKLNFPEENIKILQNLSKEELEDAAFEFSLGLKPGSDLLFYYSGYSVTSLADKANYILPVDFVVPSNKQVRLSKRRFKENSIDLATMIKDLNQKNPRQVTVVYNACTTQALPKTKDAPYWVFLKPTPCSAIEVEGASIFYPSQTREFALANINKDDLDKRSLFMRVFEKTIINNPTIEIKELQKQLAWSVAALANKRDVEPKSQNPVLMDGYASDIIKGNNRCFVKAYVNGKPTCTSLEGPIRNDKPVEGKTAKATPEPVVLKSKSAAAFDGWLLAKKLDTCESYQEFKKNFANSFYTIKADQKIANMGDKCIAKKPDEETVVPAKVLVPEKPTEPAKPAVKKAPPKPVVKKAPVKPVVKKAPAKPAVKKKPPKPAVKTVKLPTPKKTQPSKAAQRAAQKKAAQQAAQKKAAAAASAPAVKCPKGKILRKGRCIRNPGFLGGLQ
jgi:hypothetical protein